MRNLLPILWALLIFWIAGCTYWYLCQIRGHCGTASSAVSADQRSSKVYSHPFNLRDGNFSAKANDNIRFGENNSNPIIPDVISTRLTETVNYANKNNKFIDLTGYYMDGEEAALGKQRADRVKSELLKLGGESNRITTSGKRGRGLNKSMGQVHGAFNLVLSGSKTLASNAANVITSTVSETVDNVKNKAVEATETVKEKAEAVTETVKEKAVEAVETVKETAGNFSKPEIRKRLAAKNLNLYFQSGSTNVIMTDEIRDYFDDLKVFLDANPSSKVRIIGHTDNQGSAASNLRYGRQRADRIKSKLMKGGIKGSQISTESRGQESPIATNDTEEGRKLNRRVEVTIN